MKVCKKRKEDPENDNGVSNFMLISLFRLRRLGDIVFLGKRVLILHDIDQHAVPVSVLEDKVSGSDNCFRHDYNQEIKEVCKTWV